MQKDGESAANRRYALRILGTALCQALRWQMIPRNVAEISSPPKAERPEDAIQIEGASDPTDRERKAAAQAWKDQEYVFASELDGPTNPHYYYDQFKKLAREAKLPNIRLHDVRHTAASLMIRRGISPKVVSDRLSHTDPAFTLRVYTDLYDEQSEEAAFDLVDLFSVAGSGTN